jgi:predicted ATPase/class 3 adenylate cyclase
MPAADGAPPSGTVTFLFTDLEGSTRLWEQHPEAMPEVLARHDAILRDAVGAQGGYVVKTTGDGVFAAFSAAYAALRAAIEAQVAMSAESWGDVGTLRVRMGVHTGSAELREGDYHGPDVNCAARLMAAAHGSQVVVSLSSRELVRRALPVGAELVDLGEHHLRDLAQPERVFQLVAPGLERVFPPLRSLRQTNLPARVTGLVGRAREVVELVELLRRPEVHLVTLTGAGGSGKTRLAIEAAWELVADHDQGVWWVGLAPLRDSALVLESIAQTLGATDEVADHIGDDHVLLLLDNFEHVVDAGVSVAELVARCPNLKVLVTSREPLRLSAEREYPVPPLTEDEAVALFGERGGPPEPHDVVREICRRLDCLPLAVELAAARTKVLSPRDLLDRLDSRLPLLTGGPRDAPGRQRTLRATIEWSHDLLSPEEQGLFVRLAVFAGGCTLDEAEAIVDADVDGLQSLIDKSLVRRSEDRFWMLETIREFAAERLDESDGAEKVRRRHAEFFRDLSESANLMNESEGEQRHDLVLPEQNNIRAALDWAHEADPVLGLRIAVALENYWTTNTPAEGKRRFTTLLERAADIPPELRGLAFRCRGSSTYNMGDFEEGTRDYERALTEFRRLGDGLRVGIMLFRLAVEANRVGDRPKARAHLEESLNLCRGHKKTEGQILSLLGHFAFDEGRPEEAFELLERSAELCRQSGFRWWEKNVLQSIAKYALMLERPTEAVAPAREGLAIAHEIGDRQGMVGGLALLAWHAAQTGSGERAGRLWGAIDAEEGPGGRVGQWEAERTEYEEHARAGSGPEFERGRIEGWATSLDDAVAHGLSDN